MQRTVAWLVLFTFGLSPQGVIANPVADAAAPAAQRPSVRAAANGVPVVDIAAPTAGGLSHNKYQAFNVPTQGTVLNNSATGANTRLAGSISANPNLAGTPARIILNEVTGGQASALQGLVEVAGSPAKLVVANPNGITCNGCGFINTPHVQLTTGRPATDGDALRFNVAGGTVALQGSGLTELAGQLDLIAQSVRVQSRVDLPDAFHVVAGFQKVDSDTLALTEFDFWKTLQDVWPDRVAIDISQSVKAGSIKLIATPRWMDVRAAAPLTATAGDIAVHGGGGITLSGLRAPGNVVLGHGGAQYIGSTLGDVDAGQDVVVLSGHFFSAAGKTIRAGRDVKLLFHGGYNGAFRFVNEGTISAGRDVLVEHLAGPWDSRNVGIIRAEQDVMIGRGRAERAEVATAANSLPFKDACEYHGWCGTLINADPDWQGTADPRPILSNWPMANAGLLSAGRDLGITLKKNTGGRIEATRDLDLHYIRSPWDSPLEPLDLPGEAFAGRDVLVRGGDSLSPDHVFAGRNARIEPPTEDGINTLDLSAAGDATVDVAGKFTNRNRIDAGGDLTIRARDVENNWLGVKTERRFAANQELFRGCTANGGYCEAEVDIGPTQVGVLAADRNLRIDAGRVDNVGSAILAGQDLLLNSPEINNTSRVLEARWHGHYQKPAPAPTGPGEHVAGTGGSTGVESPHSDPPPPEYADVYGTTQVGEYAGVIQGGRNLVLGAPTDAGGGNSGPDVPSGTASEGTRVTNTGAIQGRNVVVSADTVINGIDFDAIARRTPPAKAPKPVIDIAAYAAPGVMTSAGIQPQSRWMAPASVGVQANNGMLASAELLALLPPELRLNSALPFALNARDEEAALRQAAIDQTGRAWFLSGLAYDEAAGLSVDTQQRAILYANAVSFALRYGVVLGQPLSETQMQNLDAPLLWYVEQAGVLVPRLYLPQSWSTQLTRIEGGVIRGQEIALSGNRIDNTGFILAEDSLDISAQSLANRKRNAEIEPFIQYVDKGYIRYTGDAVQPGGFMSALRWQLAAEHIDSVSGEFRVMGQDEADTQALSQAFVDELKQRLGPEFVEAIAEDHIRGEFVCTACKKKRGLRGLLGAIAAVAISFYAPGAFSALIGEGAAAGSTWAAATATTAAGSANAVTSAALAGVASSSASQLIATGRLDGKGLLYAGLTGGVGGYTSNLVSTGELSPLAKWSIDTAAAAAAAPLAGSSFEQVLAAKALGSLEAQGANWIGTQFLGEAGSVGHVIAHGALGALMAKLRDADPVAGALGGATEALLTPAAHQAIGPDASPELLDLVARLAAGLTAHAAGRDPLTAANAAGNAFENNYLSTWQANTKRVELASCESAACRIKVETRWQLISALQDAGLVTGLGGGLLLGPKEQLEGLADLVTHLSETIGALRSFVADPEFRSRVADEVLASYEGRLNLLAQAYEQAGWDGSVTAGVEAGRLVVELAGLASGAGAVAKLGTKLAAVSVKAGARTVEKLAASGARTEAAAQGRNLAGVANGEAGASSAVRSYSFNAVENPGPLALLPGRPAANFFAGRYNAVVLEEDLLLFRGGKAGEPMGQWFVREAPQSVAQIRIDSAVRAQWIDPKTGILTGSSPIDTVFSVKIPKGTTIYEGPVGSQGGAYLGGPQINQIYIHQPWNLFGVEVLGASPIR
ncbi:MAG: filamentous hemagglutinin N-terminal domain-containing protein [Defluviicoccus sp.]|nr:filamentous hemagglutinin N-terminal domain-containing protein [Defluviicoccus sp.]